ncbi:hypothetical protein cyc_02635 [Cyclospora cayetanensis]|uniref:Uncharacterized protein n=1 Tax=Cyclospora cayetanensis TaxID=88456 RepID=A0A1D3CRL0_9EIME|nr:hypothetical protein cyc_02635 [Cyclospora cayetanensis]
MDIFVRKHEETAQDEVKGAGMLDKDSHEAVPATEGLEPLGTKTPDLAAISTDLFAAPPDPSKRRRSTTVSQDHAGCYLAYDQNLVKKDYYSGICSFFKLVRDFKGDLTLLPAAEDFELKEMILVGLHGNEIVRYDKFDFTYPYVDLDCIALVPKRSIAFTSKHMEQAIFMGKVGKEGFGLSLKSRT